MSEPSNAERELSGGVEYVWRTAPRLPPSAPLDKVRVVLGESEGPARRLYLNDPAWHIADT